MQVIIIAAALALLNLAEAGLIAKAPRTEIPGSMTAATQLHMVMSSTTSPPPLITTRPTTTTPEELPFVIATAAAAHEPVLTADSHTPPPPPPTTTTTTMLAPGFVGGELGGVGGGVKFVQTTYWTCVARPRETHCGWHEPILDTSAAAETRRADGAAALRASLIAACAALALVFGV